MAPSSSSMPVSVLQKPRMLLRPGSWLSQWSQPCAGKALGRVTGVEPICKAKKLDDCSGGC